MKALSKPLSSPGRPDKFPPPLMRFLRSNVGSRSRGRSKSSPMFYLRSKKRGPAVIESTQEPSSPKVTCIGQVRVRRSAKGKARKPASAAVKRRRCWWLKKALLCGKSSWRFRTQKKKPFGRLFCRCGSFFRAGYCKKVDATEDSFRVYSNKKSENRNSCSNDSESDYRTGSQENRRDFLESSSSSPPKNALMLTRCRSAPYRSSSLAGRFWGSPLAEEEKDSENGEKPEDLLHKPLSENVEEEGERISEESSKENSVKNNQEMKSIGGGAVHPLILTRCKSEPARIGERLNAEAIFLRQSRLDAVQPRSQQNS